MNGQTLSHAKGLFRLCSKCRDSSHNNFCCNSLYSDFNPRSSSSSKSIKNTILLATLKSHHCLICIPSVLLCIALPHRVGSVLALFPAQVRETFRTQLLPHRLSVAFKVYSSYPHLHPTATGAISPSYSAWVDVGNKAASNKDQF
jgi:hypothetical protein